jgi:hypothetical protein
VVKGLPNKHRRNTTCIDYPGEHTLHIRLSQVQDMAKSPKTCLPPCQVESTLPVNLSHTHKSASQPTRSAPFLDSTFGPKTLAGVRVAWWIARERGIEQKVDRLRTHSSRETAAPAKVSVPLRVIEFPFFSIVCSSERQG